MKLQIDTDKKVVQVLGNVKLGELVEILKSMLGEDYKNYELLESAMTYTYYPWVNPIIIPYVPYVYPTITCNTGLYNIELQ